MDYLFPDETIKQKNNGALFSLVQSFLPGAKDQVDGIDCMSDVHIDYAQDIIEQARDELVRRHIDIPVALRNHLDFLDWRTPEEAHREAEQAAFEAEVHGIRVSVAQGIMRATTEQFRAEVASFLDPLSQRKTQPSKTPTAGVTLEILGRCTGDVAQQYRRRFEQLLGQDVKMAWCGSKGGIPMEEDSDLHFTLVLPVLTDGRFYAMVRNLVSAVSECSASLHQDCNGILMWERVNKFFELKYRRNRETTLLFSS